MKQAIIPLFIPHDGCPYRCTFCNQWRLTGRTHSVTAAEVAATIAAYRASTKRPYRWEAAFYGGSFTALPEARQAALLAPATAALRRGELAAIRLSTRPDCVDAGTAERLAAAGVTTVELGVQSMADSVLAATRRGHDSAAVAPAVAALRRAGLQVGIQLLPGLPGETWATLRHTLRAVLALRPDCVRIYPALVMADTELAATHAAGTYCPLSMAQAVTVVAWWRRAFARAGIPVIRMGLQASAELEAGLVAGPYAPDFGERVHSRILRHGVQRALRGGKGAVRIRICPADVSKLYGHRRESIACIRTRYAGAVEVEIDPAVSRGTADILRGDSVRTVCIATGAARDGESTAE